MKPFPIAHEFELAPAGAHGDAPRSIKTLEGVGDRLRAAAFAELQAREAFLWAAERFEEASTELKQEWRRLAASEQQHLDWLLGRMKALGIPLAGRKVSEHLWYSLMSCETARDFSIYIAAAELRGLRAGERFHLALKETDPETAEIFRRIAAEEVDHVALVENFFGSSSTA
jgi:uncharacterized ferritin-like protein (DUF455 family)